jgi:site-specific recombinase XerD
MAKEDYIISFEKQLRLLNRGDKTIYIYKSIIYKFLNYFKKSPKQIVESNIIDYILKHNNSNTKAQLIGCLKLFYTSVVHQSLKFKNIPYPKKEQYLPDILSKEEVKQLISVITNKKHLSIVYLLYSGGFRVSEIINLKIKDVDSKRMVIVVRQGKGKKDCHVTLSQKVLDFLRIYLQEYFTNFNIEQYLFKGQFKEYYSAKSIQEFLNKYAKLAKISKRVYPHLLRHSYSTHQLESGMDIGVLQNLLGHSSPKTTQRYIHLSNCHISGLQTPLDNI